MRVATLPPTPWFRAGAGLLGGLATGLAAESVMLGPALSTDPVLAELLGDLRSELHIAWVGACLGLLTGAAPGEPPVASADRRSGRDRAITINRCMAAGALAGLVGLAAGDPILVRLAHLPQRCLAWAVLGAILGWALGVARRHPGRRCREALAAGSFAGLAAGLTFGLVAAVAREPVARVSAVTMLALALSLVLPRRGSAPPSSRGPG